MTAEQAELALRYGVEAPYPEGLTVSPPELFPDRPAWLVRHDGGVRRLDDMAWGFPRKVPGKRIDKTTGKPVLLDTKVTNVRNYTSPFWQSALANPERRCLVLFTSFQRILARRCGRPPLFWFDVPSRPITSFAGVWRPPEKGPCSLLTTEPNPVVAPIHPKAMPVLLDDEGEERWLTCDFDEAVALARPFPSHLMPVDQALDPRATLSEASDPDGQSSIMDRAELGRPSDD